MTTGISIENIKYVITNFHIKHNPGFDWDHDHLLIEAAHQTGGVLIRMVASRYIFDFMAFCDLETLIKFKLILDEEVTIYDEDIKTIETWDSEQGWNEVVSTFNFCII